MDSESVFLAWQGDAEISRNRIGRTSTRNHSQALGRACHLDSPGRLSPRDPAAHREPTRQRTLLHSRREPSLRSDSRLLPASTQATPAARCGIATGARIYLYLSLVWYLRYVRSYERGLLLHSRGRQHLFRARTAKGIFFEIDQFHGMR